MVKNQNINFHKKNTNFKKFENPYRLKKQLIYSKTIDKLINYLMKKGEKAVAEKILFEMLLTLNEYISTSKIKNNNIALLSMFQYTLKKIEPTVLLKTQKSGKRTRQIPFPLRPKQQKFFGIKSLIDSANKRPEKKFSNKLAMELKLVFFNKGETIAKKRELYQIARKNVGFMKFLYK